MDLPFKVMETVDFIPLNTDCRKMIMCQPVSTRHFAQFVFETGYRTFSEDYEYETWLNNDYLGRSFELSEALVSNEVVGTHALYLTKKDADAFIDWYGKGRLPMFEELAEFMEMICDTNLFHLQTNAYELFDGKGGNELGYYCMAPSKESVSVLNKLNKCNLTYREGMETTISEATFETLQPAGFRVLIP